MTQCIAFLRGINVGTARRISMADLRGLFEGLGYGDVRTLLNSGNVIFECARPNAVRIAAAVDRALQEKHGFSTAVIVVPAAELHAIVAENPLRAVAHDDARYLVGFAPDKKVIAAARP